MEKVSFKTGSRRNKEKEALIWTNGENESGLWGIT